MGLLFCGVSRLPPWAPARFWTASSLTPICCVPLCFGLLKKLALSRCAEALPAPATCFPSCLSNLRLHVLSSCPACRALVLASSTSLVLFRRVALLLLSSSHLMAQIFHACLRSFCFFGPSAAGGAQSSLLQNRHCRGSCANGDELPDASLPFLLLGSGARRGTGRHCASSAEVRGSESMRSLD